MPQTHPERVSELVLRGIFTAPARELDWYYQHGASLLFPDKWERFLAPIPEAERGDMIAAYRSRLTGDDPPRSSRPPGLGRWEGETITLLPDPRSRGPFATTTSRSPSRASRTTISSMAAGSTKASCCATPIGCAHPGVIVQGRYDMPCPARNAQALHKAWPESEFHLIEGAGHASSSRASWTS